MQGKPSTYSTISSVTAHTLIHKENIYLHLIVAYTCQKGCELKVTKWICYSALLKKEIFRTKFQNNINSKNCLWREKVFLKYLVFWDLNILIYTTNCDISTLSTSEEKHFTSELCFEEKVLPSFSTSFQTSYF